MATFTVSDKQRLYDRSKKRNAEEAMYNRIGFVGFQVEANFLAAFTLYFTQMLFSTVCIMDLFYKSLKVTVFTSPR